MEPLLLGSLPNTLPQLCRMFSLLFTVTFIYCNIIKSLGSSLEDPEPDEARGDGGEDKEKHLGTVRFNGGTTNQLFNQTCRPVAGGRPNCGQRRYKLVQPAWLKVGNMKAMLRGFLPDSVPLTGSRRRRRRTSSGCTRRRRTLPCRWRSSLRRSRHRVGVRPEAGGLGQRWRQEARRGARVRRGAGGHRLRGAATLKQRAADLRGISTSTSSNAMAMSVSAGIQKGTTLRVCLPCGRVRVRTVSVFPRRGDGAAVVLRLGKKRLHGAFATFKDYVVSAVGDGGGETVVEGRPAFPVALITSEEGVTVQLLFEHQTHCKVWKAAIEGMLAEKKLKRDNQLN
ncbi:unnamed protein product [Miscanthus lutarioriparius]|uniref:Pleckstrin-like plant domain-containing protein n=1 Tax=Miscanthus lutarioriparius TaxID=422564 RepID=A0A811SLP3_9POAL|nr:unnamed protein product [Miscanthus lutarioriparius]